MQFPRYLFSALAGLAFCAHAAFSQPVPIAEINTWTIVVAEDALPSERYAAEEFQTLWETWTSMVLNLETDPTAHASGVIAIGPGASARFGIGHRDLGEEGLRYDLDGARLVITGGRPRGTLYGVYEFFERVVGARFLTHDHTWFPGIETVSALEAGCYDYTPPFTFRWSYYGETNNHPAFAARKRVNTVAKDEKYGGVTPQNLINHSFYRLCSAKEYGAEHPEYFALIDGERKLEMHGGGPELCLTNPEVVDVVTENVLADLRKQPHLRNYSVSQNDNDAYCRCDDCMAIIEREGTPMGAYLQFVNQVAERVEKEFPNTTIGTLAYWHTRKPPKTIRPRHNVQFQLCSIECCTLHAINDPDCPKNREFCEDLANWKDLSDDIWIWNYNTNFANYDLPFPNLRSIEPNVKYFLGNNVHGLFMQGNGNGMSGEMSDLRNYVISHTIWNPEEGGWARVEEFCRLHYGPAAQPILDYLTYLHDTADSKGVHPECFPTALESGLDQDLAVKAMAWFEEARTLAPDDVVRNRVEKASISAHKALLATSGSTRYEDGKCYLDIPEQHANLIDDYIALGRKHGLTRTRETRAAEEFFAEIKAMTQGFPAVQLENDIWRITVLPEENGKLTEMLHKPSGRDVVYPRGRMFTRHRAMEEWGVLGFEPKELLKFNGTTEGDAIVLTGAIDGRFTLDRRIGFHPDDPAVVTFSSRLTHTGPEPTTYQVWVHPEYDADSIQDDDKVVSVYVKKDGWQKLNEGYTIDRGPKDHLLQDVEGGFAFFNHEKGFGILQTFDSRTIERPSLFWHPSRSQVNLELYTSVGKLDPQATLEYGYAVHFLTAPPK
jgi:hypothetical protein